MTNKYWWQRIWVTHPEAEELPEPIFVEIPVEEPEKVPHVVHIPVKAKATKKPKRLPSPKLRRGKQPAKGKRSK